MDQTKGSHRNMTKILIVDDSMMQRNWAKRSLQPYDYQLIEAENGALALDAVETHKPDLILCDLNMPVMGGIECLKIMQERGTNIPVIVITADIQDSTKEQCLSLGARTVLHKPVQEQHLLTEVAKVLGETS